MIYLQVRFISEGLNIGVKTILSHVKAYFFIHFLIKRVTYLYVKMYELKLYVKNYINKKIFINKGCENRNGECNTDDATIFKNKIRI